LYRDVKHAKKIIPIIKNSRCQGHRNRDPILGKTQLDFTHMPGEPKSKLLLVFVDTFTGWVEAFPCSTERAKEVD
jgi:hypothetical protein